MTRRGATAAVLLAVAPVLSSCKAPPPAWVPRWRTPYAHFDRETRLAFTEARAAMDAGRLERAWRDLRALSDEHPDNLEIAVWRQEAELQLLGRGDVPRDIEDFGAGGDADDEPAERLRKHYAARAELSPSVVGFVLAARVESDGIAAERLVDRALDLDPVCAWAHYGRAHSLLRQRWKADRWREATEALDRALEIDPSHLRARRLEAWMDAQAGSADRAAARLDAWLSAAEGDPRVTEGARLAAELDLAATWVLAGRPRRARALLATREGDPRERARRLMLLAVVEQELGNLPGALDAARRAQDAAPDGILPLVQQALLVQHGLGDAPGAQGLWQRVADLGRRSGTLGAMLQGLRAQVELERSPAPSPASSAPSER